MYVHEKGGYMSRMATCRYASCMALNFEVPNLFLKFYNIFRGNHCFFGLEGNCAFFTSGSCDWRENLVSPFYWLSVTAWLEVLFYLHALIWLAICTKLTLINSCKHAHTHKYTHIYAHKHAYAHAQRNAYTLKPRCIVDGLDPNKSCKHAPKQITTIMRTRIDAHDNRAHQLSLHYFKHSWFVYLRGRKHLSWMHPRKEYVDFSSRTPRHGSTWRHYR